MGDRKVTNFVAPGCTISRRHLSVRSQHFLVNFAGTNRITNHFRPGHNKISSMSPLDSNEQSPEIQSIHIHTDMYIYIYMYRYIFDIYIYRFEMIPIVSAAPDQGLNDGARRFDGASLAKGQDSRNGSVDGSWRTFGHFTSRYPLVN